MSLDAKVKRHWTRVSPSPYAAGMADDPATRKEVGKRLQIARLAAGCTQDEVAAWFDINKNTVSAWETGRGAPNVFQLRSMAHKYSVSADVVLFGDSPKPANLKIADDLKDLTSRIQSLAATLGITPERVTFTLAPDVESFAKELAGIDDPSERAAVLAHLKGALVRARSRWLKDHPANARSVGQPKK